MDAKIDIIHHAGLITADLDGVITQYERVGWLRSSGLVGNSYWNSHEAREDCCPEKTGLTIRSSRPLPACGLQRRLTSNVGRKARRSPHDTSRDFRHLTLFYREPRAVIAFVLPRPA